VDLMIIGQKVGRKAPPPYPGRLLLPRRPRALVPCPRASSDVLIKTYSYQLSSGLPHASLPLQFRSALIPAGVGRKSAAGRSAARRGWAQPCHPRPAPQRRALVFAAVEESVV